MHYVKHFDINSIPTRPTACIELQGAPNAATEGAVGTLAMDMTSINHDVYKCVDVKGSVYTWELVSAGMSIVSAIMSGEGEQSVTFEYFKLRTPKGYIVKPGDLIVDLGGYLYQIQTIGAEDCVAEYSGIRFSGGGEIIFPPTEIVDNLHSTDKGAALSANQGKVLREQVEKAINESWTFVEVVAEDNKFNLGINQTYLIKNNNYGSEWNPKIILTSGSSSYELNSEHFQFDKWTDSVKFRICDITFYTALSSGIPCAVTYEVNGTRFSTSLIIASQNALFSIEKSTAPDISVFKIREDAQIQGLTGAPGKSAYEIAKEAGLVETEEEWYEFLKGEKGDPGYVPYDSTISVGDIKNGIMINANGTEGSNSGSCATDFIEVKEGFTLKVEGAFVTYSRSICVYDRSKVFLSKIVNESSATEHIFTIPEGAQYIRVTCKPDVAPKLTYLDENPIVLDLARLDNKTKAIAQDIDSMRAGVTVRNNGKLSWTKDGGDTILHFEDKLLFYANGIKDSALEWANITTDISDSVSTDGTKADITIQNYRSLVYNVSSNKLAFREKTKYLADDIVLLVNSYGTPCGGSLMRLLDLERVINLENNSAVGQVAFYLGGALDDYAVTWEKGEGEILYVTIPNYFKFRYGTSSVDFKDWASCSTHITDNIVIDGTKATITISNYGYKLVFNILDKQMYIRQRGEMVSGDFVLMVNGYGTPCGGALMRFIDLGRIMNLERDGAVSQVAFYLGGALDDYAVTWEKGEDQTLYITIPNYFRFRHDPIGSVDFKDWASCSTHITDNIVIDGTKATITITGYGKKLVFNINDKQLYIRSRGEMVSGDFLLMVNGYGTPCGGALMRFIDLGRIMSLETDVADMRLKIQPMDTSARNKIMQFATLFNNTSKADPFIFFTDPHLTQFSGEAWRNEFEYYMQHLANSYNEAPVDRVFCGGDWLGHDELPEEACYRLGLIDSTMRKSFSNYHLIVGNHDTNYQGKLNSGAERYTGKIANATIANLWARNTKKLYYKIESDNTDFYVLDTNAPTNDTNGVWDTDYQAEQYKWFARELKKNERDNIAVMVHIFLNFTKGSDGKYITSTASVQDCSVKIGEIVAAFNSRTSVMVGNETFNFGDAMGKVRFIMCGHKHLDFITTNFAGGIPVITTTHMRDGNKPTYDLCLVDYTNNKLHLVRIGSGDDRVVNI